MFGTIGWLFADLMFALAMSFLVATTVGQPPPPPEPAASPSASPTPSPTPEAVLELEPVSIKLSTVDWRGLLANQPRAVRGLQARVRSHPGLSGRRAGLVLTFGGAAGGNTGRGMAIARQVNQALAGLGTQGFVFRGAVYRPFISLASPQGTLTIDVYLFKI
ncbi:hypothetical protein [Micromonospora carbonacea]|uniref:Uncharacterized protein n=1 Tax=Micromonospora carbonacea TaxID=47853 RepID=A0A7H8XSN9_9ACTN|nr:hypothetical protein [Micromonospora carbonacea]MBB5830034.1 hypothetical protein [Micromonospora carbonacea]QLD28026.1 hypothetical protein HXZ27_30630 [Micromonospora carbonacea]